MTGKRHACGLILPIALMLASAATAQEIQEEIDDQNIALETDQADENCALASEAAFVGYLDQLALRLSTAVDYRFSEGAGGGMRAGNKAIPPEKPFVRGAAAIKEGDVLLTVQFDRNGIVTNVDVRRQVAHATYELLASVYGECLDAYNENLTALNDYIAGHISYQTAEETSRKAKLDTEE